MNARAKARLEFWIEVAAVLLFLSLVAAWWIRSATKPLDAEGLAIHAGDLRSLSAAGSLLSEQFAKRNLTETFFHEQLELMHDKVETIREELEDSNVEREVRKDAGKLNILSDRVDTTFALMSVD